MGYDLFIVLVLKEIKKGIDNFNEISGDLKAVYPTSVEIDYRSIKMVVPFGFMDDEEKKS